MNHLKKIGLGFLLVLVLATAGTSLFPKQAFAALDDDLNSLQGGTASRDRIANATTVRFTDRAHARVTIELDDLVWDSISIGGNTTIKEAFSGDFVDTNIGDGTHRWERSRIQIKDDYYASAYLVSRGSPPGISATSAELNTWATNNVSLYLRVYFDNGATIGVDSYAFFIDADGNNDWKWYTNTGALGRFDSNSEVIGDSSYRGVIPRTYEALETVKITHIYKGQKIISADSRDTYTFCTTTSGPIVRYFQEFNCEKEDLIFDSTWQSEDDSTVLTRFVGAGTVSALLGSETDNKRILIAQDGTEASQNAALGGITDSDVGINCVWAWTNPLTWIMCPLIEGAARTVGVLDREIRDRLSVDLSSTGPYSVDSGTYKAWSTMRTVALSLLVIIALVMVISQAISWGPFDAYTIKKVLPRIVAAVIFISLSWQITRLLISFSNLAGEGVGGLIGGAFGGGNATISSLGGSAGIIGIGSALLSGVDLLVITSLALTALGAVFIAFLTITFRNILVLMLVITAPIAFISWVLPNTQKPWKLWKESFNGALMAYPIIIAFITTGRVFALITSQTSDTGLMTDIIIFISYFGPYFAIPAAFRLAGGAISTIGGLVNDRSKGFFDRNRKYRSTRTAATKQRGKNFARVSDKTRLGRGINTLVGASGNKRAAFRGRGALNAVRQSAYANQGAATLKEDAIYQANQNDDKFLMALSDRELAKKMMNDESNDDATRAAWATALKNASLVQSKNQRATQLAATQAHAATGYNLDKGQEGYNQLARSFIRSMNIKESDIIYETDAAGNRVKDANDEYNIKGVKGSTQGAFANSMNQAQFNLKNAGRYDLAGINNGAGFDGDGGMGKVDPYTMASRAKPDTIKYKGTQMREAVKAAEAAYAAGDTVKYNAEMEKAQVHRLELNAALDSATGKNRDAILAELSDTVTAKPGASVDEVAKAAAKTADKTAKNAALNAWANTATGGTPKKVRENYVAGKSTGWSAVDVTRGWRTREVDETNGDVARSKARGARRPNPGELED